MGLSLGSTHNCSIFANVYQCLRFSCTHSIICTYIWWYHRDEYDWNFWLPSAKNGAAPEWYAQEAESSASVPGAILNYSFVTHENSMPVARPFIHWQHHGSRMRPHVHMTNGASRRITH